MKKQYFIPQIDVEETPSVDIIATSAGPTRATEKGKEGDEAESKLINFVGDSEGW